MPQSILFVAHAQPTSSTERGKKVVEEKETGSRFCIVKMVENLRTLDAAVVDGACGDSQPEHDMDASRDVF